MTTTQELLESSFELNLSNYGPEDVERLNDWAIKAHNALEALQAEHTDEVMRGLMLEKAHAMGLAERDAALARLAEIENQEPVEIRYRSHYPSGPADGTRRIGDWRHIDYCTRNYGHNPVALENADAVEHLYAAAGASPVEPSQAQPPAPGEAAREYMTGYSVRRR